jgi:hypothetical protein
MEALMNTYTIHELLILLDLLRSSSIADKLDHTSEEGTIFAIKNIANIIKQYQDKGPDKIFEKINEFAEIGRLTRSGSSIQVPPLVLVYDLIYEENLDRMPLYLNTPYESIAIWRLALPKKVMV